MKRLLVTLMLVMALDAGMSGPVWAKGQGRHENHPEREPPRAVTRGGMSLDDAVKMAEQRFNARVVRAETRQENGRTVYVLRLLNADGKVWTVQIDADSGASR